MMNAHETYPDEFKAWSEVEIDWKDWRAGYDRKREILRSVAEKILASGKIEQIRKDWFVDYGTANGWGDKTSFAFGVASEIHEKDEAANPDLHRRSRIDTVRGWHEDNCSCGMRSSSDSSD